MSKAKKDNKNNEMPKKVETTGHSWDGIEELNNPLPKWWLYFFYGTIVFGIIWSILYPTWPLIHGATRGILGYNSREVVDEQLAAVQAENAGLNDALLQTPYEEIPNNPELANFVEQGGGAVFGTFCAQCHGKNATGGKGYPNLVDKDWIWGGTFDDIQYTVTHGIRDTEDPETRDSEMPAFREVLSSAEIGQVVAYVQSLNGEQVEGAEAEAGATIFVDNCAACHGENAQGDLAIGAPNLTDGIWLYGGTAAEIRTTVSEGRYGMMPHWGEELSDSQIKQVTAYVHSLGGGQ